MYKLEHTHTKLEISLSTIFSICVKNTEFKKTKLISMIDLKNQGSQ